MLDLIFYYTRENRYSFNALAGALESSGMAGVDILLPDTEKALAETVRVSLAKRHTAVVALSFFTAQARHIEKLIKRLRARFSTQILILAGGPHPSGAPGEVLAMGADHVVRGEGEEAIIAIARALADGKPPKEKIIKTSKTLALDDYLPFSPKWHMFGSIEITRGCPFGCSYCQTSYLFGVRPRHRSLETLLAIVELMNSEKMTDIRFLSPDAFAYGSKDGRTPALDRIEALLKGARAILGNKGRIFFGTFPSEVRPDHVTPETLELTRRYAGNKRLVIGAQSGSQRMLDAIRRGHTVEDIYRAAELAAAWGFSADVDFILGLPGETEKDSELTLTVMGDLVKLGARIHAHTFMPLPQTPFAGKTPVPLSAKTEKYVRTLCSRGQAFGQWERQRKKMEAPNPLLTGLRH
ncbi:MAG: B12-binding domain/radical SAM domain-containing protein [Elusimicrobia bacterium GWA2_56_46]|nr:MAG: B12-binding domain/radical SAM domain-containing protein [Elusimicrobia bacterium GWA2_56_46]OGR56247.1 MAG: B12-binding domain/radical SAM domain-containing protein [Elusimicrobia bacterium GWC2_56_31]HBB66330.1 TIGR04013 family B12-binding domain/radical SAM domain-containing protein [Elusimicrobiota bacterium]HBW22379.1 TIGR04013 family B12-binding domain/radical SAM domain-containing protein [Elusimicrobiota bacterium]